MNGWRVDEMGLAWFLKDTGSAAGYFKFLPRNNLEHTEKAYSLKIESLEKSLLNNSSSNLVDDIMELLSLREKNKDWLLSQLPDYISNSLENNHLKTPPSNLLLSPKTIELLVEIYKTRSRLLEQLGGK
jgi:hypothetical protein